MGSWGIDKRNSSTTAQLNGVLSSDGRGKNEPDVVREAAQYRYGRRGTSGLTEIRAEG